ncbi:MAG: hypothetical protein CME71_11895 [Halobacteriovorax sp.]|nr:hypothetical protein [Halobacteriovorax sp.]
MRLSSLLFFLSLSALAQDPYQGLNSGFRQFGELMLATSGDSESLALARTNMLEPCSEDQESQNTSREIDLGLTPQEPEESPWRFSVMYSMGGPRDSLKKHYAEKGPEYQALGQELDLFIANSYSSHDARMIGAKELCAGKSEMEKIALASNLGSRLSTIYDYDRIDNGPNVGIVVKPEDQWNALHARAGGNYQAKAGVCRDASLSVSQFLLACGFNKDQVAIEGYRTVGGGHQVTSVRTSDGEVYTINWSELYNSDEVAGTNPAPNPNLVNSGLYYTVYDPEDGRVVEKRRTELGEVLKAVTGGTVDDPNYLPGLIRIEAGYGVLSANVFQTTTARGDFAQGVAAYIQKDEVLGFLDISAGVAYAHNTRDIATSPTSASELSQEVLYGQIEGRFVIPDLYLFDRGEQSLALRPNAVVMTEGYISSNSLNSNESERNAGTYSEGTLGLDALYNNGRLGAYVGGEVELAVDRRFNTQQGTSGESGDYGGITAFSNSYNIHGGVSWNGDRFTTAATADYTIARSGTRSSLGATLMDHESNASYSAVYSVYDRNFGRREDFIVLRAEKDFRIERIGTVNLGVQSTIPLASQFDQASVGLSIRFVPGRR